MRVRAIICLFLAAVTLAEARPKRRSAERSRYVIGDKPPVLLLTFNDGNLSPAADWSLEGNNGTIANNVTVVSDGAGGTCANFTTGDDQISCGTDSSLNCYQNITISHWLKAGTLNQMTTLGRGGSSAKNHYWVYHEQSGNGWGMWVANVHTRPATPRIADPFDWDHMVITWRTSDDLMTFYFNGAYYDAQTSAGNIANYASSTLRIGVDPRDGGGLDWVGDMDEIVIYPYCMSAGEVSELYNRGKAEF